MTDADVLRECIREQLAEFDLRIQTQLASLDVRTTERLAALQATVVAAIAAQAATMVKTELASEKRFDSVNEFRRALSDQTATFVPRTEIEQRIEAARLTAANAYEANATRIRDLERRAFNDQGRREGISATTAMLISLVGLLATIVIVIVTVKH